ncbi:altered inheritance rate of mitochondria protein 25-like isoform X1 [Papaver somniferum]|uniref:altered inheritance rate of mitochondria protein 25-like isoform X1 n=1 Tax=Papaver somniferum TaxID=3469 RepID=UPI000E6F7691|nr:altered inheritance rate of mitochondria protein 25-like isoform X1 [Papaver somniferum]XP_026406398.1 altered inheritance rate of mitochondria protein 25-like isoform X1 [Papaver somniferum]XP_026406400.1 altered inheritance rate of mitochondria protein 25-like isoform X1 [Papaver somniferum]
MKWIKGLCNFQKHVKPQHSKFGGLPYLEKQVSALEIDTSQNVTQRCYSSQSDPDLSRDWFAKLWVADKKRKKNSRFTMRTNQRFEKPIHSNGPIDNIYEKMRSLKLPLDWWPSNASVAKTQLNEQIETGPAPPPPPPPPPSQSVTGSLKSTSKEEALVAPLLARSNLLITRDIEWANLVLGFEQENRYAIVDASYPQAPVGFIREQSHLIARQILRTRRPFVACVTDAMGNEVFKVRRPFWWITSTIYVEIDGKEIGVVHRRWHLWRRVYDLYLGNTQFAVVENPGFWFWTFTLKDINGKVLAEIDRDWRGLGFELFTDAGQYVIRFGRGDAVSKIGAAAAIQDLEVERPLTLSERAVAVALAVSLDNDYFSRHGGWGIPFVAIEE